MDEASNEEGIPLIWTLPYGKGNLLVMNNSLMTYKSTGGVFLSLLADVKELLLYPVINAKAFALEAFPLPTNVNQEFMKSNYLRTGQTFLRDLWWPDMVSLSVACDIKYTAGFLAGYEKEEAIASESVLLEEMDFHYYNKELVRYGGELAFTGFNQKPLYFGELSEAVEFEPWTTKEIAKLRSHGAFDFFNKLYPNYEICVYLPPERLLDEEGYNLIKETFPQITTICGDFNDKEKWYQDFGVDKEGIVSMPVVTKGFRIDDADRWDSLNVSTAKGIQFHSCDVSDFRIAYSVTRRNGFCRWCREAR